MVKAIVNYDGTSHEARSSYETATTNTFEDCKITKSTTVNTNTKYISRNDWDGTWPSMSEYGEKQSTTVPKLGHVAGMTQTMTGYVATAPQAVVDEFNLTSIDKQYYYMTTDELRLNYENTAGNVRFY